MACSLFKSGMSNMAVIINYLKSDLIKKQRAFKIGLVSIYLVVFFITMLMNVISLSPMIFIRLSEEQVGEADIVMVPTLSTIDMAESNSSFETLIYEKSNITNNLFNIKLINFTDLQERLKGVPFLSGVAPRWIIKGNTTHVNEENVTKWSVSNFFILDSKLENKQGMGRDLHAPVIKENECYISTSLRNSLKLNLQDKVGLEVKLSSLLAALGQVDVSNIMSKIQVNSRNYDTDEEKREKPPTEEKESITGELQSLRPLLKRLLNSLGEITITKQQIKDILRVSKLPEDFSLSLNFLNSPFAENLPFIDIIRNIINNSDTNENINEFIYVNKTTNRVHFRNVKDKFTINLSKLNLSSYLDELNDEELDEIASLKMNLTVKFDIAQSSGKWPSGAGNVIAIDSNYINYYLDQNLNRILKIILDKYKSQIIVDILDQFLHDLLSTFKINNYALTVNAIIKDKFDAYSTTQTQSRKYMSKKTEQLFSYLGQNYPVSITMPIYNSMKAIEVAKVFLENIFRAINIFLWLLSVLLIYSLMLGNVDERTYEFGMLRSLGFKKSSLTLMIIAQGFIFAIPGVILGLCSSYIANNYIGFLLNWYSVLVMPYYLSLETILWGVGIGISIPLISSYFPIKKALDANLKETLTIFNKKIGDLVVSMVKLENYGISLPATIASIIIIVIGFMTYYVAPLSFLLMNPSIFIFILTMIMLIMLLGLIIIVQMFIPIIQRGILFVEMLIFYKDRNIHFLVKKNLDGHARRNKKVSIMFMIALGFIIFAGCTLNLIVSFVKTLAKSAMGGDAFFWLYGSAQESLNEIGLKTYMANTIEKFPGLIQNYSFVTHSLGNIIKRQTSVGSLNGYPRSRRDVIAVDQNYIQSGHSELYMYSDYNRELNYTEVNGKPDIISILYKNPNMPKIIKSNSTMNFPISPYEKKYSLNLEATIVAAEGIRKVTAIGIDNPCAIVISGYRNQVVPCNVVGFASKLPGSPLFSSYSSLAYMSPVITSMDQMKKIIEKEREISPEINKTISESKAAKYTEDGISKAGLLLKFNENGKYSDKLKLMVYTEVKNIIGKGTTTLYIEDIIKTADKIKIIIEYVFLVLGIIALILSFFLIWTSFYSNIKENICEYGITRSIGLTRGQSSRMYLYEASSIIISSIITGTFIGVVISVTLILQFNMFVELPFIFNFPYKLYFILVSFGLGLGMLGSYYPIYEVNQMSLIKIMKGISE